MNVKTMVLGAGLALASTSASALNIALTNDDGWSTPGIQALYEALTEAGHTVLLAGPLDAQSGSGTGFNIGGLEVTRQGEYQYSVALEGGELGAEPATSGAMGLSLLEELTGETPDLLVSGINDGANLAAATYTSGTVGAALHAVGLFLGTSIPAIAVSTDERCDEEAGLTDDCREVAEFIVDYIDHLEQRPGFRNGKSGLVPNGRALNINYPPVEPKGVKIASQGKLPLLRGSLRSLEIGCAECGTLEVGSSASGGIVGTTPYEGVEDVKNSDQELFDEGYITVVVVQPNLGANAQGLKGYLRSYRY
jgi:5'/3'-nucleotidase